MKLVLASAFTASPNTFPLSECPSSWVSEAKTGAQCSFIATNASAQRPVTSRSRPVPNTPSTITSVCSGTDSKEIISPPRAIKASALCLASPESFLESPSCNTRTAMPSCRASLAITKPSPPLLPVPHTTVTSWASGHFVRSSLYEAIPALSIRVIPGISKSSMVVRSNSRTCSAR